MSRVTMPYFLLVILLIFKNSYSQINNKLADECSDEVLNMFNNFIQDPLAYLFLKDTGKGLNNLGHFNLCEGRNNTKYLALYILNLPTVVSLGICLPNTCQSKDLENLKKPLATFFTKILKSMGGDGTMDLSVQEDSIFFLDQKEEKEKFKPVSLGFYLTISFFIIMALTGIICAFKVI